MLYDESLPQKPKPPLGSSFPHHTSLSTPPLLSTSLSQAHRGPFPPPPHLQMLLA